VSAFGELTGPVLFAAAARWVVWLAALAVIGAAGGHLLLRQPGTTLPDSVVAVFRSRTAGVGLVGALLLIGGLAFVLIAQLNSWFGPDGFTRENAETMIGQTRWGQLWLGAAQASIAVLAAALGAWLFPRARGLLLALASIGGALTVPLIGHGSAHGTVNWLAHAAHLAGAGIWLGSLAVLARTTWVIWRDDSPSPAALASLLGAFSRLALTGATLIALSGLYLAWLHITPVDAAWTTEYGRTLLLKLAAVAAVVLLGYRNWRMVVPAIGSPGGLAAIRRSVRIELTLAFVVVLIVTAWLSGLPVPG
jgi:putative copper export protein